MNMQGAFDHTHKLIIKTSLLLLIIIVIIIIIIITTTTIIIIVVVIIIIIIIIYSKFPLSFELLLILRTNLLQCHCSEVLPKKTT